MKSLHGLSFARILDLPQRGEENTLLVVGREKVLSKRSEERGEREKESTERERKEIRQPTRL